MRLTIELTPEQGIQLFAAAKTTGIDLADMLRDVEPETEALVRNFKTRSFDDVVDRSHFYFTASREEFRAALDRLAEMNKDLPVLPLEDAMARTLQL